jgi:hypothetical protein
MATDQARFLDPQGTFSLCPLSNYALEKKLHRMSIHTVHSGVLNNDTVLVQSMRCFGLH